MRFDFYRPSFLPGLVEGIWEQRSTDARRWRILPTGWVELIFRLGPEFSLDQARSLGPDSGAVREFCFLSGLHTRPLDMSFDRFHVFGIRLHPAGVRALLGIPCSELRDGAVDGDLILDDVARIEDGLRSAPDFRARARWVERELLVRFRKSEELGVAERMRDMAATLPLDGNVTVGDLADRLGYSRGHAHRIFNEWLGQSATGVIRLGRFVRSVHALHRDPAPLTEIGYRLGYYDQSHFIRSFREYSGLTPGEYQRRRGGMPGQLAL